MTGTVAIAIPAYQAGPSVAAIVTAAREQAETVLVIDDGSDDDTADQARGAGAEVIRLPRNRGKGVALRTAFATLFERGHQAVVTIDADGQHLPREVPKLISGWQDGGDLVLGTRDHLFAAMGTVRRISNRLSSRAISFAAGASLGDIQTGFRLYTRSLIEATGFPEPRFQAESAVIVRAVRRGFRVVSVPVELGFADGRTTSHYRPLVDSLRIAIGVIGARFERHPRSGPRNRHSEEI